MSIERIVETKAFDPDYSDREFSPEEIAEGKHRAFIGGHWDSHGQRQFDFLMDHGLRPEHKLLDVGCGCFRAGRFIVDELDSGNYFGVEASLSLLEAGYAHEFTDAQRAKCPESNLRANERFKVDFGVDFDMAIAQSVFTHVRSTTFGCACTASGRS